MSKSGYRFFVTILMGMIMKLDIIDVFGAAVLRGNPLAVVHGGEALETAAMQALTDWLGFSETTFLLPPTAAGADYKVRIFCPGRELPFAGHPTLGTCHAWLAARGVSAQGDLIVQECGVGLVELRRIEGMLAFRAPPTRRVGALSDQERDAAAQLCHVPPEAIEDAVHAENGPAWQLLRLRSVEDVLGAQAPARAPVGTDIGLIAAYPARGPHSSEGQADFEVRAFFANAYGVIVEDPVTGSLNAAAAQYLFGAGLAQGRYVAAQGRKVGADGRVVCVQDGDGAVWVAGKTVTVSSGADLVAWA
jgi:PhzF family phenazine biosynthesis protein